MEVAGKEATRLLALLMAPENVVRYPLKYSCLRPNPSATAVSAVPSFKEGRPFEKDGYTTSCWGGST